MAEGSTAQVRPFVLSTVPDRPDGGDASRPGTDEHEAQLALLTAELDRERRRVAIIQEINTALGSTLNYHRLLALIADKTSEILGAERSTIFEVDEANGEEIFSRVAHGGEIQEIRLRFGEGVAGWVAKTGHPVNLKDAYRDGRFRADVDQRTGFRTTSMLCWPLKNPRKKVVGVIQALNKRDGYFTLDDEHMIASIASQAAVSLESSRLYVSVVGKNLELMDTQQALRRRVAEIDLLYRLEQDVNQATSIEAVVNLLLLRAKEAIPSAIATALISDTEGYRLFTCPNPQFGCQPYAGEVLAVARSLAAQVAEREEPFRSNQLDVLLDTHDLARDTHLGAALAAAGEEAEVRSALCVPLSSGGERFGALELINRRESPEGFSEEDLKLLSVIAGQAESAIVLARQRVEAQVADRLAAIGRALATVLHDLKTPMTVISGYSQLMVDEDSRDERKSMADLIKRQSQALKSMTQEILAFARGEANLLIRKVHLGTLLTEVKNELKLDYETRGDPFEVDLELGYDGLIRLDDQKFRRLVVNLAKNAREAMPKGGRFTIRTAEATDDPSSLDLWFIDTGPGIPEAIRSTLFDSFVTHGKRHGTGLGLAIVKKIVEQHGGTIGYESEAGRGTVFHVRLPKNLTA